MWTLVCYDGWKVILDDWVREASKQQLSWGVPCLQWSKSVKHGPKKEEEEAEPAKGSFNKVWFIKPHYHSIMI